MPSLNHRVWKMAMLIRRAQQRLRLLRTAFIAASLLCGIVLSIPCASWAQNVNEAIQLNNRATSLQRDGQYSEAERLFKRALVIVERLYGPNNLDVAASLNNLADLYDDQGRYADAEPLYNRSLGILTRIRGPNHPDTARILNNLALLYKNQGRYSDAEALLKRSLAIQEKSLGSNSPDFARSLNNLATVYGREGRHADAELLQKRALAIREKTLGPDHLEVASSLNNLAADYQAEGRYADAEPFFKRSLAITEKSLGPDHPDVAKTLNNLALLYETEGRYANAEPLYKRSITITERAFGPNNPNMAAAVNNLAMLYQDEARFTDAELFYKRALAITEGALGPDHPYVASTLNNLATLYEEEGRYADAELLQKRALAIREKALGPDHPEVAELLNNLASGYEAEGRYADAEPLFKRSLAITEKALGLDHPDVATWLNNLALLYDRQGRYADAEPLVTRSLAITEKSLGLDHLDFATSLSNLALLYDHQGRYTDAEQLYKRSLAITEKVLGVEHPHTSRISNSLAALYQHQERYIDALPIVQKSISQDKAQKDIAFVVLNGSRSQNLIAPAEAVKSSYIVFQRSSSSTAGKAVSMLAARFASGSNELAQLVRKDQDLTFEADRLDKSIMVAVSKSPAARNKVAEEQIRKRVEEIKLERHRLQNVFNQRFPDYVALSKPQLLSLQETQELLAADEALIAIDLDAESYIWVITTSRAEWKKLPVSDAEITKEVATLRGTLDPHLQKPFDSALAYQLYQQVLGPIEDVISDKSRLTFVLSGALTSLPPQVLVTSDPTGKDVALLDWLVRKYAITVLPSVESLKILRTKGGTAAVRPLIGFADPIFDAGSRSRTVQQSVSFDKSLTSFYRGTIADTMALSKALPALPETADELRRVAYQLGARPDDVKLGEAATVTSVKRLPLDNYLVIYFATHALVAGQVEKFAKAKAEPALVLSIPDKPTEDDDGLLRASDVAMLKMNADFVVLSACNTAAGDKPGAEALSGLARAFFYAGARSLIVSNWEVDSESTVALMTGLFDALKDNPRLSHAEAQRLAILQMINNPRNPDWREPSVWAPFVVIGEPQRR